MIKNISFQRYLQRRHDCISLCTVCHVYLSSH